MKVRLAALLSATALLAACSDGCEDTLVTRLASPDGAREAVLFERSCGATTGFSTQIAITRPGRAPSRADTVFISELGQAATQASWNGPWAGMAWLSRDHLQIRHDAQAGLFRQNAQADGVRITYQPVSRSP